MDIQNGRNKNNLNNILLTERYTSGVSGRVTWKDFYSTKEKTIIRESGNIILYFRGVLFPISFWSGKMVISGTQY